MENDNGGASFLYLYLNYNYNSISNSISISVSISGGRLSDVRPDVCPPFVTTFSNERSTFVTPPGTQSQNGTHPRPVPPCFDTPGDGERFVTPMKVRCLWWCGSVKRGFSLYAVDNRRRKKTPMYDCYFTWDTEQTKGR